MLHDILLVTIDSFSIRQKSTGDIMAPSKDLVLPGDYEIVSGGEMLRCSFGVSPTYIHCH